MIAVPTSTTPTRIEFSDQPLLKKAINPYPNYWEYLWQIPNWIKNTYALWTPTKTLSRMQAQVVDPQNSDQYKSLTNISSFNLNIILICKKSWIKAITNFRRNEGGNEWFSLNNINKIFRDLFSSETIIDCSSKRHMFFRATMRTAIFDGAPKYASSLYTDAQEIIQKWMKGKHVNINQAIPVYTSQAVAKNILNVDEDFQAISDAVQTCAQWIRDRSYYKPLQDRTSFENAKKLLYGAAERALRNNGALAQAMRSATKQTEQGVDSFSEEVIFNALTSLFFVSRDTTASLILYLFHALGKNAKLQQELYDEWQQAQKDGETFAAFVARENTLLHATILEGSRLNPSVPALPREVTKDMYLNDHETGESIFLKKGSLLLLGIYFINRDKSYWENPNQFNPHRYLPPHSQEQALSFSVDKTLSFGNGPNVCLGRKLAQLEAKTLILAAIEQCTWKATDSEYRQQVLFAIWSEKDVMIDFIPRDDSMKREVGIEKA